MQHVYDEQYIKNTFLGIKMCLSEDLLTYLLTYLLNLLSSNLNLI